MHIRFQCCIAMCCCHTSRSTSIFMQLCFSIIQSLKLCVICVGDGFMNEMRLLCLEIGGGGGGFQPVSRAYDNIIVIKMRRGCDGMQRCCLHENALLLSGQACVSGSMSSHILLIQIHQVNVQCTLPPFSFEGVSYKYTEHSQLISYRLGYWIIHLVLVATYPLDFCSFLHRLSCTVFQALSSFTVAKGETQIPVLFHASVSFSAIVHHTITLPLPILTD